MRTNLTEGFWVNSFLTQIENREFNMVMLDRKTIAGLMEADYSSVDCWMNMRNRVSSDKIERLIQNMPPAAFAFFLEFQASMRKTPAPAKPLDEERAEMMSAAAKLELASAKAREDGETDPCERQELRMLGSILASETSEYVQAMTA